MKIKTIIATGAMLASFVVLGSAKSWDIVVDSNTKAGSVILPAGNYSVKLANNQAMFTSESGQKFTVPVKVDTGATKKFDQTEVKTAKQGDTNVIQAIDLGGTTEELQFGE
jgi:cytochrome c biogenesis protein ResB